ncbi:MAG TPA: L-threonylcarbamoyladenylate synthase [Bacilli bacterium]
MLTQYWTVDPSVAVSADAGSINPSLAAIQEAAEMIRAGKVVAFPTETVYGLGADARSDAAVERVFAAKGRPSDNPLIVHIASLSQLDELVGPRSATAQRLMERFWPGPLTLVLPARPGAVSKLVTAGLPTVAVRRPAHPLALLLLGAAGCPVAAPSANRSGRPSPTEASHVKEDLDGCIDGIIDGGPTRVGLESTVVEVNGEHVRVLRPGCVTLAQLEEALAADASYGGAQISPFVLHAEEDTSAPKSPGTKYGHYAPRGTMFIVMEHGNDTDSSQRVRNGIQTRLTEAAQRGEKTGVLVFTHRNTRYKADLVINLSPNNDLSTAAQGLYSALRRFDTENITYILAESCSEEGIGHAIMNRLLKAAGNRMIYI